MPLTPREAQQSDAALLQTTANLAATDAANLALIAAVLGGSRGTRTTKNATQSGVGTTIIHTVTSGKSLYIHSASLAVTFSGATGTMSIVIRDTSDVAQGVILYANTSGAASASSLAYPFPVVLAAGWDVVVTVAGGGTANATIHGYEV